MKYLQQIIFVFFICVFYNVNAQELELEYYNTNQEYSKKYEVLQNVKGRGWKQFKRWQSFWKPRLLGKKVTSKNYTNELKSFGTDWESLGPFIVPLNKLTYPSSGLGRINAIKVDPQNINNIWLGSASGGLWKSESRGAIWNYVEIPDLIYPGIGDIAIPKKNPNMVFVASGDANGYFMLGAVSSGIYYSFNKGNNWEKSEIDFAPEKQGIITSITCNDDASAILVSSSFGIYKSVDSCKSWTKIHPKYTRHLIKDNNSNSTYFATEYNNHGGSTFIKSTDSGNSWTRIKVFDDASRLRIAQSPSNPARIYIIAVNANNNGLEGFYISNDYGESWEKKSNLPNILGRNVNGDDVGGQGHYDLALTVHPTNQDIIFVGGIHVWMSSDAGSNWDIKNYWIGKYEKPYMHADQHDLVFVDTVLFSANDGGVYSTDDLGETWKDRSNGLNISQIYKLFVAKNYENLIICGSQDNGAYHGDRWNNWFHILGGDATYSELAPDSFSTWLIMSNNGVLNKSVDFGAVFKVIVTPDELEETADWITPFQINPLNSNSILLGYNNLWVTEDQGWTYRKLTQLNSEANINLIEISNADTNLVYFSNYTNLYRHNIKNESTELIIENSDYAISAILSDSNNTDHFYIAYSGFNDTLKVVEYLNGVRKNISEGLPNYPVNDLLFFSSGINYLFAATDIGVYFKSNLDSIWHRLGRNLPNAIITDIDIDIYNNRLIAASFGMGVKSYNLPECNIESLSIIGDTVLCPKSEILLKTSDSNLDIYWSNGTQGSVATIDTPGKYFYIARNKDLCLGFSDTINVVSSDLPDSLFISASTDSLYTISNSNFKYQWIYNDTLIENSNHNAIKKAYKGYYKVTVSDSNGCEIISSPYYLATPVDDFLTEERSIQIKPNPITEIAYFDINPLLDIKNIEIYDNSGKLLKVTDAVKHLSFKELSSGVYILKFICSKEVLTYRVIKQ